MAYTNVDDEKSMRCSPWKEGTICDQIIDLFIKLRYDSQGILKKGDDDQKTTKPSKVSTKLHQKMAERRKEEGYTVSEVFHTSLRHLRIWKCIVSLDQGA